MMPETSNLRFLSLAPDRNGEAGAECEIILPDYCPNILRILQATAHPTLTSAVRTGDRLTAEGSVEYKILYLPEDGNGVQSLSQHAHFSCTVDLNCDADAEFDVFLTPKNCVARALNPKKIHVRSTVALRVKIDQEKEIHSPALPEGCEEKVCKKNGARHLCSAKKPLRISDEFEMDSSFVATEILYTKITFRETEQKPLTDKLIVKADMIFDLLCKSEDNRLVPLRKTVPISQILDLPDLHSSTVCKTGFELISSTVSLKEEEVKNTQIAVYDVEIRVSGAAYEEIEGMWTEDAYSVKKEVECTKETVLLERFLQIDERGSFRETAEIGATADVLWVDATPELRGIYYHPEEDLLLCDGVWDCRILRNDDDATPSVVTREMPFSLSLPANGCKNPVRNDTELVLTDVTWSAVDASHVEIQGNYRWKGLVFGRESAQAVTKITEAADRAKSGDTVTLYYTSAGESAWNIAKEHACPYRELMQSNGLEQDYIDEDRMLVIVSC